MTVYQHYYYDKINPVINFQLEESNSRFSDRIMELLTLSSTSKPKDNIKSFKVDVICKFVSNFYPKDFNK